MKRSTLLPSLSLIVAGVASSSSSHTKCHEVVPAEAIIPLGQSRWRRDDDDARGRERRPADDVRPRRTDSRRHLPSPVGRRPPPPPPPTVPAFLLHCPARVAAAAAAATRRPSSPPVSFFAAAGRRRRRRRPGGAAPSSSSSMPGGRVLFVDDDYYDDYYDDYDDYDHRRRRRRRDSSSAIRRRMSLIPAPANELGSILPTSAGRRGLSPTGDQYVSYLGRTPRERYDSLFEGAAVAFLGSMFAYFVSFVVGQFLATCLGIIFLFWPILGPEFKAYQRNWELAGGRDLVDVWMDDDDVDDGRLPSEEDRRGLYGAYYIARVDDVCVVDDVRADVDDEYDLSEFDGYAMSNDELEGVTGIPWKLRLRLSDDAGRGMQVHSRMSEGYLGIRPGMIAVGVLLSAGREFRKLAGMTDFCVLDVAYANDVVDDGGGIGIGAAAAVEAVAWVGDYPYLDKAMFLRTLDENGIADMLLDDFARCDDDVGGDDDVDDDDIGDDDDDGTEATDSDDVEKDDKETDEYINVR